MIKATADIYKNAYSGLSRSTWLLSFIMLINRSGTMVVPFMTLYLTSPSMGYSVSEAGIVFGVFGLGAFCGAYLGGKLTDKIGHYKVQLLALAGGGILFMIVGQLRDYHLICLFTFLLSFVNEAFRPANAAAIAIYSKPENRTRSYSLNRLAINLGWAAGSAVGGFLAKINYELLFWVDGFTNLSAAIIMWLLLKPEKKVKKENAITTPVAKGASAYRDKGYLYFILLTILFATCFFQLFTNVPVYLKKELHYSEPFIGLLMAINGLIIALIEMVLVYKLEAKGRSITYMIIGTLFIGMAFAVLALPLTGVSIGIIMILLISAGEMIAMPFMNSFWINRSQPANRGQYAALYTMAWSAAQTLGPMGGASIADTNSFSFLWWIIVGLTIVTCLFLWYFFIKKKETYHRIQQ